MIATKTTALMMALGMLAIASMMFVDPSVVYAQNTNVAANSGENEDNDKVEQENKSEIKQESENKCESEAAAANVAGVVVGDDAQDATATSFNDCDSSQTAAVVQSNTNTDNDVQFNDQEADAEQEICEAIGGLVGFNVCGNELELD